jgi:hypothetical protein
MSKHTVFWHAVGDQSNLATRPDRSVSFTTSEVFGVLAFDPQAFAFGQDPLLVLDCWTLTNFWLLCPQMTALESASGTAIGIQGAP